jgi:hypothetical protein
LLGLSEQFDQISEIGRMKFSRMFTKARNVTLGREGLQVLPALLDISVGGAH